MISIFVYKDSDDRAHWQWNMGAEGRGPLPDEPNGTGQTYIRVSPIPSIVLPWDLPVVDPFFKIIKQDGTGLEASRVTSMQKFIADLRNLIGGCNELTQFKNDPLCVFIHFGGNSDSYNTRLHDAWERLGDEKNTFLCFAISRRDSSKNCINQVWVDKGKDLLTLPDSFKGLEAVLKEGWKMWKGDAPPPLPQAFLTDESVNTKILTNGESSCVKPGEITKDDEVSKSQNSRDDNNSNGKSNVSNDEKCIRKSVFGCVLKWIVAIELLCWSALSLWKFFVSKSLKAEVAFGVIGLTLLIIPVGVILALHEDDQQSR